MNRWKIEIQIMPFSGACPKAAGAADGNPYFYVDAENMRGAMKAAEHVQMGIKANPAVWEAPIIAIVKERAQ